MSRFGLGFSGGVMGNDPFTKILLHMDGANGGTTFTDSNAGGSPHSWAFSNATTSTAQAKFGVSSMLAAAGFVATVDSTDFTLGAGDFTIDFWFNANGNTFSSLFLAGQLNSTGAAASSSWEVLIGAGGVSFIAYQGAASVLVTGVASFSGTAVWTHVAVVRSGATLSLYLNGVLGASVGISGAINDSAASLGVGRAGDFPNNPWSGYIDEFRLSVGVARWSANFTPPTAPYSP